MVCSPLSSTDSTRSSSTPEVTAVDMKPPKPKGRESFRAGELSTDSQRSEGAVQDGRAGMGSMEDATTFSGGEEPPRAGVDVTGTDRTSSPGMAVLHDRGEDGGPSSVVTCGHSDVDTEEVNPWRVVTRRGVRVGGASSPSRVREGASILCREEYVDASSKLHEAGALPLCNRFSQLPIEAVEVSCSGCSEACGGHRERLRSAPRA